MNNAIMAAKGEEVEVVAEVVEEALREEVLSVEGEDVSLLYSFSRDEVMQDGCEARLQRISGDTFEW
jgi:hypothetical protein